VYGFERGCIHVWQVHNGVKFPDFLSQNEKTEEQKRDRADKIKKQEPPSIQI